MSFDWYKRNSGWWLDIELDLTLEQAGALNILGDMMHKLNAALVDDDTRIAKHLGIHVLKWRAIKKRLLEIGALQETTEGRIDIAPLFEARSDRDRVEVARRLAQEKSVQSRKINDLKIAEERRGEKRRVEERSTNSDPDGSPCSSHPDFPPPCQDEMPKGSPGKTEVQLYRERRARDAETKKWMDDYYANLLKGETAK